MKRFIDNQLIIEIPNADDGIKLKALLYLQTPRAVSMAVESYFFKKKI